MRLDELANVFNILRQLEAAEEEIKEMQFQGADSLVPKNNRSDDDVDFRLNTPGNYQVRQIRVIFEPQSLLEDSPTGGAYQLQVAHSVSSSNFAVQVDVEREKVVDLNRQSWLLTMQVPQGVTWIDFKFYVKALGIGSFWAEIVV